FADASFDLVFSVDVVHHVRDRVASIVEAHRVLRPHGRFCMVTDDEDSIRTRVHSRYFPELIEPEVARYPSLNLLRSALQAAHFTEITEERTAAVFEVTDLEPYRQKAFSSLHLIGEEAHRRGLANMEADLRTGPIAGLASNLLLWATKA